MKQIIEKYTKTIWILLPVLVLGILLMSFQDSPTAKGKYDIQDLNTDTFPDNDHMTMKQFDRLMNDLDTKIMLEVGNALKSVDVDKIMKDAEASIRDIDIEKIVSEATASIKNIDLDKIMADVQSSLKDVDWNKHKVEVEDAMKEARKEIEKAKVEINKIDKEEIRRELEKAKLEVEKSKDEIKKIDVDKIMKDARKDIDEAKVELRQTKEMFNEMERDGLISQKDGFSVEYKNKELFINGKKQSESITDKYRKYIKGDHFRMTIDKE